MPRTRNSQIPPGVLPVRELRRELTNILGIEVTKNMFEHWQDTGLIERGPVIINGEQHWDLATAEIVYMMVLKHCRQMDSGGGKVKYKRPGIYRACELQREIERRIGVKFYIGQFQYFQRIGLIPPGDVRIPKIGGGITLHTGWTDRYAEEILANLEASDFAETFNQMSKRKSP